LTDSPSNKTVQAPHELVSQPTFGPDAMYYEGNGESATVSAKIPIVHAHGFLCHPEERNFPTYSSSNGAGREPSYDAPNMLVFRDLDYWRMTANPTSFANHTLLDALTTTRCIFVGLSFKDINLLRWIGTLAAERADAWRRRWDLHFLSGDESVKVGAAWARRGNGHRWLTDAVQSHFEEFFTHRDICIEKVDWNGTRAPDLKTVLERLLGER